MIHPTTPTSLLSSKTSTSANSVRGVVNMWRSHRSDLFAYLAILALVAVVYVYVSDGDFSSMVTFGAVLRTCALAMIPIKLSVSSGIHTATGLSIKCLQLYGLALGSHLVSITLDEGYLPMDATGDWFLHLNEVVALSIVAFVLFKLRHSAEADHFGGRFGALWLVLPCLLLAVAVHPKLNAHVAVDIIWSFSTYLEAVAVVPQLYKFQQTKGVVESFNAHFVALSGFAGAVQLTFWVGVFEEIGGLPGAMIIFAHVAHVFIMADFMYYYVCAIRQGKQLSLPQETGSLMTVL